MQELMSAVAVHELLMILRTPLEIALPSLFFAILNADIYRACTLILHMVMHKSYYIPVRSSSGFHELKQLSLVKLFLPTYSRLNN